MRAAVLLLVIGAIACGTKGEEGVAAMEKWSRTICGCKDLACAQENTLAMKHELDRIESSSRGEVSDSHVKRLAELGDRIATCIADLKAAEAARTGPADAERHAGAATKRCSSSTGSARCSRRRGPGPGIPPSLTSARTGRPDPGL